MALSLVSMLLLLLPLLLSVVSEDRPDSDVTAGTARWASGEEVEDAAGVGWETGELGSESEAAGWDSTGGDGSDADGECWAAGDGVESAVRVLGERGRVALAAGALEVLTGFLRPRPTA